MMMKRFREEEEDRQVETLAMANCLMLLSNLQNQTGSNSNSPGRIFHCKTCNKPFNSFQALGGHRASHKRTKLPSTDDDHRSPPKPKTHECSICGLEFAMGQALGGHMRRHRDSTDKIEIGHSEPVVVKVMKRSSSSSKRILWLDLNLTPYENDVKLWRTKISS